MTKEVKPEFKTVYDVLHHIQINLKAPKSNVNKFGNYNYRSCEDIVESVKVVMPSGATLRLEDDIVFIEGRFYIKATATLTYNGAEVKNNAFAREPDEKKGSDASQVTGATSSYARKYALNGLFMIDDTKDADATNQHGKTVQDQQVADALGGSVRKDVDKETAVQMYDQALKDIAGCADLEKLKSVWTKIAKGKPVFSPEQWADLEQAKDEAKKSIAPF